MIKQVKDEILTLYTLIKEFIVLILVSVLIFMIMNYFDHKNNQIVLATFLIIFSLSKICVLMSKTLNRVEFLIRENHKTTHVLFFFLVIIISINVSFTLDYLCVSQIYSDSFAGLNLDQTTLFKFFDLLYFSIVTFTTVGYGDIFPVGKAVKVLTILEMATSFITIAFIISRYTKHANQGLKTK